MNTLKLQQLQTTKFSLFSDRALVVLISVVTLLLQIISFVTTWNGSRIYLGDIFPHAALFFALAIQATAYCFSNALRRERKPLRVLALCVALCCSTYYSYIGIYNSVNSPAIYLEENYVRITRELSSIYQAQTQETISGAMEQIHGAASKISAHVQTLKERTQLYDSCLHALEELKVSKSSGLKAPKQASFETYEEYAAAYQAYINSFSQAGDMELKTARTRTLAAYGFTDEQSLNTARQENEAVFRSLCTALDTGPEEIQEQLTTLTTDLITAVENTSLGQPLTGEHSRQLSRLFQASQLCGFADNVPLASLLTALNQCAQVSSAPLMKDYSLLPKGSATDEHLMQLKAEMDSQILHGLMKINTLLDAAEQLSYSDSNYAITDLYLLPICALKDPTQRMTAFFCLGMAALVDLLSVLFAASLPQEKPLWKRRLLRSSYVEEYAKQIYASLPDSCSSARSLADFLQYFGPSPRTEADGYMMSADTDLLQKYRTLSALLCQVNLAKLVPAHFLENEKEQLLLKARFVFWANEIVSKQEKASVKGDLYE